MNEEALSKLRSVQKLEPENVKYLIIHCTATSCDKDYTEQDLERDHEKRGFLTVGYHYFFRKDGTKKQYRPTSMVGAHCKPYNSCSIGICYEGGIMENGKPGNTMTQQQFDKIGALLVELQNQFPNAVVRGHRDMPLASKKACPCFDAKRIFKDFIINEDV